MGEVYVAQDESLERSVALKVLPPDLVRNEERVRRFVKEAKSASSLSHPHIVTIYEIGRDRVRCGDAAGEEAPSDPVHFISMELVTGETLKNKIHVEKMDLRTLVGHLAQAAEGLAKAHAVGIVHRDLKPSNIMVSRDGYAKVLDFGLAKLTEREASRGDMTQATTRALDETDEGVVVGTIGYMSPEQVQGKPVDHRSDIFSFGCILYEAATRRRPFLADSDVETLHQILHDIPTPVEDLNPETPAALCRLIRRCLPKNPDQRFQSMKDLAIELQEIVDEYDSLSPSGSGSATAQALAARSTRGPAARAGIVAAVVIGVVGIGLGMWGLFGGRAPGPGADPFQSMRMTTLLSGTDITSAVLSADGRYLAYGTGPSDERTLWVRQVATGSDVRVLPPQESLWSVSFSPDGAYIYYLSSDPETPHYSALFEVPSLGGTPRKRLFDVDSPVSFAPDGRRVCFWRGVLADGVWHDELIVADLDTREERTAARIERPEWLYGPVWAPHGERIAAVVPSIREPGQAVVVFDASSGERETIASGKWTLIESLAWLPEGESLVLTGESSASLNSQVWLLSLADGSVRRITNDLDDYYGVSVSQDAIAATRYARQSDLWVAPTDGTGEPRQLTYSSGRSDAVYEMDPLPDGSIAYTALRNRRRQLWTIESDGEGRRQITSGNVMVWSPRNIPGRDGILFSGRAEGPTEHVFRTDAGGDGPTQLTDGPGEWLHQISPDGRSLLFSRIDTPGLWSVGVDGGEPRQIVTEPIWGIADFSPDGQLVRYMAFRHTGGRARSRSHLVVIPAAGGDPIAAVVMPPAGEDFHWAPDGRGFTFVADVDGIGNVWKMSLDGPEPVPLTRFDEGDVTNHEWSHDGRHLLVERRVGQTENIWRLNADGSNPIVLTDFRTGLVFDAVWSEDDREVVFAQGNISRDVLQFQGFR
jgi:Tol biopolymer transport system component